MPIQRSDRGAPWGRGLLSRARPAGQVLVGAILVVSVLLLIVPLMVQWSRQEARWSVKQQKSTVAFNLADAAIDRGMWKLKSSTSCWAQAAVGTVQAGYNFDTVYTDIEGGRVPDSVFDGAVRRASNGDRRGTRRPHPTNPLRPRGV
jgi:Tfp pilus assembly protein PilX